MPASPIIEIKNLSAGYDNRTVLHDINLTIYERDFWVSSVPTVVERLPLSNVYWDC